MRHITCTLIGTCLVTASAAMAGDCLISDNFNDNNPSPLWTLTSMVPSAIGAQETGGRLGFWGSTNNFTNMLAGGFSNGWKIDMTQDWSLQARWHISAPTPDLYGDSGIALAILLEGDPSIPYIKDGVSISGGRTHQPTDGIFDYEIARKWNEGDNSEYYNYYYRDESDNTLYVWYLASIDTLIYNYIDDPTTASVIPNIHSVSPSPEAWIGFGVYSFGQVGSVPAFNSNNYWADDFCLRYGNVLGNSIGACCTADECSLTLAQSCSGTFMGAGSDCDSCTPQCECDLDGSGHVGVDDLLQVISAWGACSNCPQDFTGDNWVGVDDLLLVIGSWGPCP